MVRPIGLDAVNDIKPGVDGCTAVNDTCLRVISGRRDAGALVDGRDRAGRRDWCSGWPGATCRVVAPVVAAFSTWIPWFKYDDRPVFFFYAICIIPFTVIVLAMIMGRIIGPTGRAAPQAQRAHRRRRSCHSWCSNFAFMYPILTDQLLTRHAVAAADVVPELDLGCGPSGASPRPRTGWPAPRPAPRRWRAGCRCAGRGNRASAGR